MEESEEEEATLLGIDLSRIRGFFFSRTQEITPIVRREGHWSFDSLTSSASASVPLHRFRFSD